MICIASLRSFIVRTANLRCCSYPRREGQIGHFWRDLDSKLEVNWPQRNYHKFRVIATFMAEQGASPETSTIGNELSEKDYADEREVGYASLQRWLEKVYTVAPFGGTYFHRSSGHDRMNQSLIKVRFMRS
ncbi:hypothetical protein KSP39_PZI007289 [Platanthera zijinensis]|uniref:Uncharacterized protein n=1 Tax=Platanthera zijinensis TaxID=2320716 RepID=A0AAP0GA21_9ASPA